MFPEVLITTLNVWNYPLSSKQDSIVFRENVIHIKISTNLIITTKIRRKGREDLAK